MLPIVAAIDFFQLAGRNANNPTLEHKFVRGEVRRLQQDRVPAALQGDIIVGGHAVDPDDLMTGLGQPFGDMKADKSSRSRDEKTHR